MPRPNTCPQPARPARCGAWALACALLLSGCAALFGNSQPPAKEATDLEIQIEAAALLNPDDNGRPSPLLVRVYELRNDALFQDADFFGLYNTDKTVLQGDMLSVDQFILRPGESRSLRRKSNLQAGAVGVLAAYRDLPNATWRALVRLPPARDVRWYSPLVRDEKVRLRVQLQGKLVSIIDLSTGANSEPPANTPTRSAHAELQRSAGMPNPPDPPQGSATLPSIPSKEELLQPGQSLSDALKLLPGKP
jgi:type VI secretion system protein VasD